MRKIIFKLKPFYYFISTIVKLALVVLMALTTFNYLNKQPLFRNQEVNYDDEFFNLPENCLDYVYLGSSHVYYGISPTLIYKYSGLYGYTKGSDCQSFEVSYEYLKNVLRTQSPKLVILDGYFACPSREGCRMESNYIVAQYKLRGEEKYNVIKMLSEEKQETYSNEWLINHNNWKNFENPETFEQLMPQKPKPNREFGYHLYYAFEEYGYAWQLPRYSYGIGKLDEKDVKYLNLIYELCKENNIELMLTMIPYQATKADQDTKYALWQWADEKGIKYLDFFNDDFHYFVEFHGDTSHSNIVGVNMICDDLSDFIKENYSFDHHGTEQLDNEYSSFFKELARYEYHNELDPERYLRTLKEDSNTYYAVKYTAGMNATITEERDALLNELGINLPSNSNYYAILKDKKILYESFDEPLIQDIEGHHIELGSDYLVYDDDYKYLENETGLLFFSGNWYTIKSIDTRYTFWETGYYNYQKMY